MSARKIAIVGAGMMGTAITWPLADRGHEIRLVGTHLDGEIIAAVAASKPHPKLGLMVPEGVRAFPIEKLDEALSGIDLVVLGVSSAGVRWAGRTLKGKLSAKVPILMIAKGLEWNGSRLTVLPDVLASELGGSVTPVAVGGPCIAGELARRVDTCIVFTGRDVALARLLADVARNAYYRVYPSADLVGVEVCAALKNAFAMGVGIGAGMHEQRGGVPGSIAMHNFEAAVFAQSVLEMQHMARLAGGDVQSAVGLPGAGDLTVTCNGGRTGRFGKWLGTGLTLPLAIERMQGATLECLEVLDVLGRALAGMDAQGTTRAEDFPLLRHLCDVAKGAPVSMPFERFFQ